MTIIYVCDISGVKSAPSQELPKDWYEINIRVDKPLFFQTKLILSPEVAARYKFLEARDKPGLEAILIDAFRDLAYEVACEAVENARE